MPLLLREWAGTVRRAEQGRLSLQSGCPCCDGFDGLAARDELEAIIRRGGGRGRRVATLVGPLDATFLRSTFHDPAAAPALGRWWRARLLDR